MANLLTLEDFKLLSDVKSSANDEKYEYLLTSVSKLVRTYCGQEFDAYASSPGKTELFDIQWNTHVVQLSESPVIAVTNVYERQGQSDTYTELFKDGTNDKYEWYFDSVSESVIRTNDSGSYKNWLFGVGAVKIIYTAGYTTLPSDLKLAVADLVTYYHKDEYRKNQTLNAATREGAGSSSVSNDPGFPDHIRRVLDLYRNV